MSMKITLITTQTYQRPLVGGVDVYTDRVGRALARQGHTINILAADSGVEAPDQQFAVERDELDGFPIWRLRYSFAQRPKEAFDTGYDDEMETAVRAILHEQQPNLVIILNFYTMTLATVKAAKSLGIPVFHIATDFLPVCRRATFIRWHGGSCEVGESIKTCAACFVSNKKSGRIVAETIGKLPEDVLVRLAGDGRYKQPHPLAPLNPYWHQIATMKRRLEVIQPLRDMIDHTFVPTRFTEQMFVENGFAAERVHHLPFGVDPEHPLSEVVHLPADHVRFLFIGRFQPYKGLHLLLEAFNKLENPQGATLTIYGAADGHDGYYDSLMAGINSNERIHFLGKIPPSELATAFAEADYFLLPSTWHENSPLIVSDALQSSTPVIASDIGGVTDIVKHDINGLLFPMGDATTLQTTLQRTINDPELGPRLQAGNQLQLIDTYVSDMLTHLPQFVHRDS